jgi:DNA-binding winged helix-turn-helix (wHTH) protein
VVDGLCAFLSSLALFENRRFLYKMILPERLKESLALAGSVDRRRVDAYSLSWSVEDLTAIVARRIALAAGEQVNALTEICGDKTLIRWLQRTGGESPRGWLECVTPLVAQYLRRRRPISTREWKAIRKRSPPPLAFNDEDDSVTTGWRRIDDLPEVPLVLLRYLYEHRDRVCTRDELYHQAYLSTRYPDTPWEERRTYPKEYATVLDTAISRLRHRIEPDPRSPVYIVTKRGKGYKLEHAW